jgi:hypothetical protein
MQTVIQVIATGTGSLRNKIMSDPQLEKKFEFIKVWHKQPGARTVGQKYTALGTYTARAISSGTRAAKLLSAAL